MQFRFIEVCSTTIDCLFFSINYFEDGKLKSAIIFGGTGFIGSLLGIYLLEESIVEKVYLCDFEKVELKKSEFRKKILTSDSRIELITADVKKNLKFILCRIKVDIIFNLAAVHREPGHADREYYETNILGAENICDFAESINCRNIIFTSSISPYGVGEAIRDEKSMPLPSTPYGNSKLIAEKIHQIWQARDYANRRLVVVRPGVVFGPGEGGNVSRLIKSVLNRYFCYTGNKKTRKAGVYVKELCNAMWWVFKKQEETDERVSLFNMSMNPGPSISEYVSAICKVAKVKRFVPNIPYKALLFLAYCIDFIATPFGLTHPFSPVRIRKLVRSNNILPSYLIENGYEFKYTLVSAFEDWQECCPEEWQ